MRTIDLAIIYLACGSTLAVFKLNTVGRTTSSTIAVFSLNLIFWPVFAIRELLRLRNSGSDGRPELEQTARKLMLDIENTSFSAETPTGTIFAFRQTFERFVGLGRAKIDLSSSAVRVHEVANVVKHPSGAVATACLNRRDRLKVEHQFNQATLDMVQTIEALLLTSNDPQRTLELLFAAADLVDSREKILFLLDSRDRVSKRHTAQTSVKTVSAPSPLS